MNTVVMFHIMYASKASIRKREIMEALLIYLKLPVVIVIPIFSDSIECNPVFRI